MDGKPATFGRRFAEFRASKAQLFWSCAATAVATIVVGFAWGGWVTGGTAASMSEQAATNARVALAADVCVERFKSAEDARVQLAALKATSGWTRSSFVDKGGWAQMPGENRSASAIQSACADRLAALELPPQSAADASAADASEAKPAVQ